jgi:cell shape-determining protein MreC
MNFKTIHVIAVCFALLSGPLTASAGELYLWTDEKGGKHITDAPPDSPAKIISRESFRPDSQEEIRRYNAERKKLQRQQEAETRLQRQQEAIKQQINSAKRASDNPTFAN